MEKKYLRLIAIAIILIAFPLSVRFENNLITSLAMLINATLFFIYRDEKERQSVKRDRLFISVLILSLLIIILLNFKYLVLVYIVGIIGAVLLILSLLVDKKVKSLRRKDKFLLGAGILFLLTIILFPFIEISIVIWLSIIAFVLMIIGEKMKAK